jgi:hypothetical protein
MTDLPDCLPDLPVGHGGMRLYGCAHGCAQSYEALWRSVPRCGVHGALVHRLQSRPGGLSSIHSRARPVDRLSLCRGGPLVDAHCGTSAGLGIRRTPARPAAQRPTPLGQCPGPPAGQCRRVDRAGWHGWFGAYSFWRRRTHLHPVRLSWQQRPECSPDCQFTGGRATRSAGQADRNMDRGLHNAPPGA